MRANSAAPSICLVVQAFYDLDARVMRKAEALVAAGYSVDVLALRPSHGKKCYVQNGVNVYTVSLGKLRGSLARYAFEYAAFLLWAFFRLAVLMRSRQYAVIDVNTLPDFLIFAAAPARWAGAKLLLDMHEITPEFYRSKYGVSEGSWIDRLLKYQERMSFDYADHVLTINQPIQDLLVRRGLPASKSTIVMNAADERRFAASPASATRLEVGSAANKFVMMYHGTLTKIYGLDIALEAFAIAHHDMPNAELWILGPGPELKPLAQLTEKLGLSSKVKLMGPVPSADIPGWLAQCTVGILPIRCDVFLDFAFPNKLPECVLAGKPVIVSRLKAIRHYFSEEAVAYFEPTNIRELAAQMVRLRRDPALRAKLKKCARQEYEPIRWSVMKNRYLAVIDTLANPFSSQAIDQPTLRAGRLH